MSGPTEEAASAATDGGGGSALSRTGAFLLEHWRAVGALVLVGVAVGAAYRRGLRKGRLEVGGVDDAYEGDDADG